MKLAIAALLLVGCALGPSPLVHTHHELFRAAAPSDIAAIADKVRHEYKGRVIDIVSHEGSIWLLAEVPGP